MADKKGAMVPVRNFSTIQDLYGNLGIPLDGEGDFTIYRIEDIHKEPRETPLFRAEYYSFLFIRSGRGSYTLDGKNYSTGPFTVYFTNPGHLKSFKTIDPYAGYLVTFTETFLKSHLHPRVFESFPFLLAEVVPPGNLVEGDFNFLSRILEMMLEKDILPGQKEILAYLWGAALWKIKQLFWDAYHPGSEADLKDGLVRTFLKNLEETYAHLESHQSLPNVQDYARRQNLHPNYFQTVIKTKTGKTPLSWITEKTLIEARALLEKSPLSIKEISGALKFPDPSQFSRFMKKHLGLSPQSIRIGQA